ncbi:unnamed protein product [Chrysoparadoxa australica]
MAGDRYTPQHPFISGGLTGIIEIFITYPLEYTKVKLQLQDDPIVTGKRAQSFSGPAAVIKHTLSQRGFRGLYVGLSAWLTFAMPRSAIRFTTYESLVHRLEGPTGDVSQLKAMAAGTVAGAVESATCLTPLQCIQIKMTHDTNIVERGSRRFKGFFHAVAEIARSEGVQRGFFSGLQATVVKGAIANCVRFGCVNEGCRRVREWRGMASNAPLDFATIFLVGATAGALSAVVTHPIDTVKSNLQGLAGSR